MRINYHSFVDVITNSSTVIYTYQSGCIPAVKEVLNEMLKLQGETKTADELFYVGVFCDADLYSEYVDNMEEDNPFEGLDYEETGMAIDELIEKIQKGEEVKPEWMEECENSEDSLDFNPCLYLHISAKDGKYKDLAEKLVTFLNSQESDGGRDG